MSPVLRRASETDKPDAPTPEPSKNDITIGGVIAISISILVILHVILFWAMYFRSKQLQRRKEQGKRPDVENQDTDPRLRPFISTSKQKLRNKFGDKRSRPLDIGKPMPTLQSPPRARAASADSVSLDKQGIGVEEIRLADVQAPGIPAPQPSRQARHESDRLDVPIVLDRGGPSELTYSYRNRYEQALERHGSNGSSRRRDHAGNIADSQSKFRSGSGDAEVPATFHDRPAELTSPGDHTYGSLGTISCRRYDYEQRHLSSPDLWRSLSQKRKDKTWKA
ncbi:hypothetical protein BDY21DRAFT_363276 [Lineolata rhizophorae]|uniref:Uncharacterized protein n=1 Tax=Lineolata rhizophorae TaxID=578093 RepID=A0A6A6P331_9PEZI|nr:hypothetical protein BDY21DRAFT_363276 [Lineolata rhizophorae]